MESPVPQKCVVRLIPSQRRGSCDLTPAVQGIDFDRNPLIKVPGSAEPSEAAQILHLAVLPEEGVNGRNPSARIQG
jgi:hypothetical protein